MKVIDGKTLKILLSSGAANLSNCHKEIDDLNVFPVPDGDTGTNMSMTFTNGVQDAMNAEDDFKVVAKSLSRGLLMGARGNSGVILSQIFRGFYQEVIKHEQLDIHALALAFNNGTTIAYKAVMRPVEGTILTVIRESSANALEYYNNNTDISLVEYLKVLIDFANESLNNTPNLLPVLKEVGVVDSGGSGLLKILDGFLAAALDKPIEYMDVQESKTTNFDNISHDEFGYCTEFIVRLPEENIDSFSENKLKSQLGKIGDSLVVVQDEDLVKVHVHTLVPGDALNLGQRYGEFIKLKIENMQEQNKNLKSNKPKKYGLISVAAGEGLINLFKEYNSDVVISGGQTMNPSTEDFISAINKVNAENIFLFPNNSNIILAAKQAQDIIEDKNIYVIESKTIVQGLRSIICFNVEDTVENNLKEMNEGLSLVNTGTITYAVKDTTVEGVEIKEGDFMGIYEKEIICSNNDIFESIKSLLDKLLLKEDSELLTIIIGEQATNEQIDFIKDYVNKNTSLELEIVQGDQPVYNFILGIE